MNTTFCFALMLTLLQFSGFAQTGWHNPDGSPFDPKKVDRYFDMDLADWRTFQSGIMSGDPTDTTNTMVALKFIIGREKPDAIAVRIFYGDEYHEETVTNWIPFREQMNVDLGEGDGHRLIYAVAKWNKRPGLTQTGSGFGVTVVGHGPRKSNPSELPVTTVQLVNLGKTGNVYSEAYLGTNQITLNSSLPSCDEFKLRLNNVSGRGFILFASTNLTDWNPILTNFNNSASSTFDYTDTNAGNYQCRFFQVRPLP